MALPAEVQQGLYIRAGRVANKVPNIGQSYSQITGVERKSAWGNCNYVAVGAPNTPAYRITDGLPANFLFISNIGNGVALGIVPRAMLTAPIYVFSDNYGGCQFHIASSADAVAFLHVYRGGGGVANYTLGAGWTPRGVLHSNTVPAIGGPPQVINGRPVIKDVGSFAYIAAGTTTAECCFLEMTQGQIDQVHGHTPVNF